MRKFFAVSFFAVMLGMFVISCSNPADDDKKKEEETTATTPPFVKSLAYRNGTLYAACQRLDVDFSLYDTSKIAIINTSTDAVTGSVALHRRNPAAMSVFENIMLVATAGSWNDIGGDDAGLELIDLTNNTNLGTVANGSALGGNPQNVVLVSADRAYVTVMTNSFSTVVLPFNVTTGAVGSAIAGIGDAFGGIVYDGSMLYVGDMDFMGAGVAVVDPATDEVVETIATEMGPIALAVIAGSPARIAVAATDYSASNFEIISADGYTVTPNLIPGLWSDISSVRSFNGGVYIVESFGKDNVVKYDPDLLEIVYQQSIGVDLNIQDIAVVSETKAYISALNSSNLVVFNPATGTVTSTIDLSSFNTTPSVAVAKALR